MLGIKASQSRRVYHIYVSTFEKVIVFLGSTTFYLIKNETLVTIMVNLEKTKINAGSFWYC